MSVVEAARWLADRLLWAAGGVVLGCLVLAVAAGPATIKQVLGNLLAELRNGSDSV